MSVSRSIFALTDDRDRMYFGRGDEKDQIGFLGGTDARDLRPQLCGGAGCAHRAAQGDEAIAEADTILLTVPNQLGVGYNAHVIESILKHVAPGLGWR